MTRLEELRKLLDACRQVGLERLPEHARVTRLDRLHHSLDTDTVAALLDVAEAVDAGLGEIGDCEESWECADGCCLNIVPRHGDLYNALGIALAPLMEVTDD